MTYQVDKEKAVAEKQIYEKRMSNYGFLFKLGLTIGSLGLSAAIICATFEGSYVVQTGGFCGLLVGAVLCMLASDCCRLECMSAKLLEIADEYKIVELKHRKYSESIEDGYFRITAITEDKNGNIAEQYVGVARGQSNTNYTEPTLDANAAVLYFPYPYVTSN